jgi:hypothetical protein
MVKKVGSAISGIFALAAITLFGYWSFTDDNAFLTVLYGVVTAAFAPIALSLIQWAFKKPDKALEDLKKVPAIQKLLEEVKEYEVNVKNLKDERDKLLKIIQEESRCFMLQERKDSLEKTMICTKEEIDEINALLQNSPMTSYKYLPDIIKRVDAETRVTELTFEDAMIRVLSDLGIPTSRFIIKESLAVFEWTKKMLARTISKWKSSRKKKD